MKKGKLLAFVAGLVLVMGLVLVGCDSGGGSGGSGTKFEGKWIHENGVTSFTFTGGNYSTYGTSHSSSGTFTFTDTELTLNESSGRTLVKGYTLSGNKLTIAQGNGGNYGPFTKQ